MEGRGASDGPLALDDLLLSYMGGRFADDDASSHVAIPLEAAETIVAPVVESNASMSVLLPHADRVAESVLEQQGDELVLLSPEERDVLLSVLQEEDDDDGDERDIEGVGKSADRSHQLNVVATRTRRAPSASGSANAVDRSGAETDHSKTPDSLKIVASREQQQQKVVVKKSRRHRKRRKHEVDALRLKVKELVDKLEKLRRQEAAFAGNPSLKRSAFQGHSGGMLTAPPGVLFPTARRQGVWESIANSQREQTRGAMIENMRLRAQYEAQLQTVNQLEALYRNQQFVAALNSWQGGGAVSKYPRLGPFDDDAAIFASLGRDFDAQYAKIDAIIDAAGLTNFDGEVIREMQPRRGANGIFFLENVLTKVVPQDMYATDRAISSFMTRAELHTHHELYEVREITDISNVRKIVDTIRLPQADATLIVRTALKRYKEEDRIVVVWDAVLEVTGSVSMRFRERGWKLKRRPHALAQTGPISIEQTCVRITPELQGAYSEQDLAAGTLANMLIASYHQHTKLMHLANRNRLAAQFEKCTI